MGTEKPAGLPFSAHYKDEPRPEALSNTNEALAVSEVQLLLAEKRTSLAALRTGIAVFVLPLSVLSVLTATSKYYDLVHVLHFIIPLLVLSTALVLLASYLIIRSLLRMRRQDKLIAKIKESHPIIAQYIE